MTRFDGQSSMITSMRSKTEWSPDAYPSKGGGGGGGPGFKWVSSIHLNIHFSFWVGWGGALRTDFQRSTGIKMFLKLVRNAPPPPVLPLVDISWPLRTISGSYAVHREATVSFQICVQSLNI